jgi:hypothetical protein
MSLSSLIVQREIASIREVEEALSRQVLYGGDLVTNLLEVVVAQESPLTQALAESFGMQPAQIGELPRAPEEATRLVPKDLAVRHSILPLAADRTGIVVAVAEPLTPDVEQELSFALSLPVAQRVSPLFRIRQAIAREYDVPLERRYQRLLARLNGQEMAAPNSLPPLLGMPPEVAAPPRPPSDIPRLGTVEMPAVKVPSKAPSAAPGPVRRNTPLSNPPPPPPQPPPEDPSPRTSQSGRPFIRTPSVIPAVHAPSVVLAEVPPAPALPSGVGEAVPSTGPMSPRATSDLPPGSFRRPSAPAPRPLRRRRGPLSLEAALAEMDDAGDRDVVLDLFFEFAKQFFEYSAFFLVRAESADGRDAFGSGLSRDKIPGLTIPLDASSMVAAVLDKRSAALMFPSTRVDNGLMAELQIDARTPLLLFPLVVRKKAVALLIGDGSDAGVDPEVSNDLTRLAAVAASAFERLIVRRKLTAAMPKATVPEQPAVRRPPSQPPAAPLPSFPASRVPKLDLMVESGPHTEVTPYRPDVTQDSVDLTAYPAIERGGSPPPPSVDERVRRVSEPPADEPPPATVVQVRRPSGPPIPREEPNKDTRQTFSWEDYVPPASEQKSVPARRPPAPVPTQPPLPSVIVDLDQDYRELVERHLAGDESAGLLLLRAGQHAMSAIMDRFPGPVSIDRVRYTEPNPPRAQDAGPLLRLIAGQRLVAFPFVVSRVEDPDPARRMWAVLLISELPYPEAIKPVVTRLFDPDPYVRAAARIAARAIAEHHAQLIVERIAAIASSPDEPMARRVAAIEALGELREPLAGMLLINALADPTHEIADAARIALRTLTRHDFGSDPRTWFAFWQSRGSDARQEWLIAAIAGDDLDLASHAADEISTLAKRSFGFRRELGRREREKVRNEAQVWWDLEGRLRSSSRGG